MAGDEQAFTVLLETHHFERIRQTCSSEARRAADVDDAVQQTLIAAWDGLPRFRGRTNAQLSAWLYRVSVNATRSMYRAKRAATCDLLPEQHRELQTPGPGNRIAIVHEMRDSLAQLPAERCEAVKLAAAGYSYEEIAYTQVVAVNTVKSRVSRARQDLGRLLDQSKRAA